MTSLLHDARAFQDDLVELRRDLHRHPELSFQERRTAAVAADHVQSLGYDVRREVGITGVVAEIGAGDGPVIALRADMDALPIQEGTDAPYTSTVDGVMHACGHDAHVTMLVGAARLLAGRHDQGNLPPGRIRLLFQPSEEKSDEENKSGAVRMIEDGALRGVDAAFAIHVGASDPAGKLFVREGPIRAGSETFRLAVKGSSAHAARPHQGVDAVVLAAHVVLAAQNAVARRVSPTDPAVLTIGRIQGGVAENIIAEAVHMEGTMRYFDPDVLDILRDALRRAAAVAETLGGSADLELRHGYPPVINDPAMAALARAASVEALGEDSVVEGDPALGAEDFAYMLREVPGAIMWLGAALDPPRRHHHPAFDIDESTLPMGASVLAACAIRALTELR